MRDTTMMTQFRSLGRVLGAAALGAMIIGASCGPSDSEAQSKSEDDSGATVLKTAAQSEEQASAAQAQAQQTPAKDTEAERTARQIAGGKGENPATDGPRLKLDKDHHDFGKIYDTNPQVCQLKITNAGNKPLTVQRISTSCGCTSTNKGDIENRPIPPGESRTIEVKYKPKATAQKVTKTVTIMSDDFVEPVQRFKISAQLIEPARLEPIRYQMGQIRSGEGHKTSFYVVSPDPNLEVLGVESNEEYLSFEVHDDPNDDPNFPGRKRIDITISEDIPSGPVKGVFRVQTKAAAETGMEPVEQELNGMILGHVRGELTNNPRFLRIRNVGPGEEFEVRTMLYSENSRPFEITGTRVVDSTIQGVTVETVALEPYENDQPGYWVIVRGTLEADAKGAFQGKVLVDTDIPNEAEKAIIFNGIVRRPLPGQ